MGKKIKYSVVADGDKWKVLMGEIEVFEQPVESSKVVVFLSNKFSAGEITLNELLGFLRQIGIESLIVEVTFVLPLSLEDILIPFTEGLLATFVQRKKGSGASSRKRNPNKT